MSGRSIALSLDPLRRSSFAQLFLLLVAWTCGIAQCPAAIIYVDSSYTGTTELGTASAPFKRVSSAEAVAQPGDTISIKGAAYPETLSFIRAGTVQTAGSAASIGTNFWGRLANPGFEAQPIKATLFFAGRPLDGTTNEQDCATYAPPAPNATNFYTLWPLDSRNLNWTDLSNPGSAANRNYVLQMMADAGLNVVSMSSWGESWLPCTTACPQVPDCGCWPQTSCPPVHRCFHDGTNRICRIGWYGAANMQVSPVAKDQLFDAAVGKPLLIMPFIESRFEYDWNFHDEFPTNANNQLAPGLISQIEDLLNVYVLHPRNPQWPAKWAQVYDQDGKPRYALTIVQVATLRFGQNDANAHTNFAAGFDRVAEQVFRDTGGLKVGFFIDPIAPDPTNQFCTWPATSVTSVYGSSFKPTPKETGRCLRFQKSILGIQCFSPEGWIDARSAGAVDDCYKLAWKRDFSSRWFATGIPFLQDVTPGYDGTILFANRPNGLKKWGYTDVWRNSLAQMVRDYGKAGFVYNAWNGYPEGLAAMTVQNTIYGTNLPPGYTIDWLKSLTAIYH